MFFKIFSAIKLNQILKLQTEILSLLLNELFKLSGHDRIRKLNESLHIRNAYHEFLSPIPGLSQTQGQTQRTSLTKPDILHHSRSINTARERLPEIYSDIVKQSQKPTSQKKPRQAQKKPPNDSWTSTHPKKNPNQILPAPDPTPLLAVPRSHPLPHHKISRSAHTTKSNLHRSEREHQRTDNRRPPPQKKQSTSKQKHR